MDEEVKGNNFESENLSKNHDERMMAYLRNLESFNNIDAEELEHVYPEGMVRRDWTEVNNPDEIEKFRVANGIWWALPRPAEAIFRSSTGEVFLVPTFGETPDNVRQLFLDALAEAKRRFPDAPFQGLSLRYGSGGKVITDAYPIWTYAGTMIEANTRVLEETLGKLATESNTEENGKDAVMELVAAMIHEGVHMRQDVMGGGGFLMEIGPTTMEYLSFPGKLKKMADMKNKTLSGIAKGELEGRYERALAVGLAITMMEQKEDFGDDEHLDLGRRIANWTNYIEALEEADLQTLRESLLGALTLKENDLQQKIHDVFIKFPEIAAMVESQ